MNKRIFVFIDSQNLKLAIKGAGWKLDFQRLFVYLKDKFSVSKAFLFIGYLSENEVLYSELREIGYILIFKPTLRGAGGFVKGNCDAELVLHAMIQLKNYERAIIISGDGDFYCLIDYLKTKNKLLKVGIPYHKKYSALLREFSPHFFYVSKLKNHLEYKNERHRTKDRTLAVASHRDGRIVVKKLREVNRKAKGKGML